MDRTSSSLSSYRSFNPKAPHDRPAERAVLGAMLIDPRAAQLAGEELKRQDFYTAEYSLLFDVLSELHTRRPEADLDIVSVESEVHARGLSWILQEANLLKALMEETPTAANIERYCQIVQERAAQRSFYALFKRGLDKINQGEKAVNLRDWLDRSACELPALSKKEWSTLPVWNVADLAHEKEMQCLWDGLLARGCVTLLHAPPKTGKTYTLFGLLHAMCSQQEEGSNRTFLGLKTEHAGAVYMTEEGRGTLNEKRVRFGLDEKAPVWFLSRREREFARMPLKTSLRVAGEWAQAQNAGVIVIDSLGAWSGMQGEEENNAAHTEEVFNLFKAEAAARNVAVLVIHHSQKNGNKARGSSALEAAADVIVRLAAPDEASNRRTLLAKGRFRATPERVEFDLTESGYVVANSEEGKPEGRAQQLLEYVPMEGEGITKYELGEKVGLGKSRIKELIFTLLSQGRIEMLPRDHNTEPARYRRLPLVAGHMGQGVGEKPASENEGEDAHTLLEALADTPPVAPNLLTQVTGNQQVDPVLKAAWEEVQAKEKQLLAYEQDQAIADAAKVEQLAREHAAAEGYVDEALERLMEQESGE